jgi:hypothetical protein
MSNSSRESAAREQWMQEIEEELYEEDFGFGARVRIMAILWRHYAARAREEWIPGQ